MVSIQCPFKAHFHASIRFLNTSFANCPCNMRPMRNTRRGLSPLHEHATFPFNKQKTPSCFYELQIYDSGSLKGVECCETRVVGKCFQSFFELPKLSREKKTVRGKEKESGSFIRDYENEKRKSSLREQQNACYSSNVSLIISRCSGKEPKIFPRTRGGTWTGLEKAAEIEPARNEDKLFYT